MKFYVHEIPEYSIPGVLYSLVYSLNTDDISIARGAFARLYEMMKYYAPQYGVSFLMGLSNVEANTARKTRSKRRGRKTKVRGKKVPFHIHAIAAGERAKAFIKKVVKCRNKKDKRKLTSSKALSGGNNPEEYEFYDDKGAPMIDYIYRQSVEIRSFPKDGFDFRNFEGDFYRVAQD